MQKCDLFGICAVGLNNIMGNGLHMPWEGDEAVKWDMHGFKETTTGHPIIMGYKTYLGMGERALPNRLNFVVDTHSSIKSDEKHTVILDDLSDNDIQKVFDNYKIMSKEQTIFVVSSISFAKEICQKISLSSSDNIGLTKIFLIGGAKLFREAGENDLLNGLRITHFLKNYEGDIKFPNELFETNFISSRVEQHDNGFVEELYSAGNPPSQRISNDYSKCLISKEEAEKYKVNLLDEHEHNEEGISTPSVENVEKLIKLLTMENK